MIVLNGALSGFLPVRSGVPQGAVVGPLLFLLYINDITDGISEIRLFADDYILYRQIRTHDDCITLQQDIDKLHHWSHTWQMAFNSKNCHTMTISRKRERPTLQYKLSDEHLSAVESFTYLGVTISIERVHDIYAKATRVLNFIRHNIYHYT